MDVRRTRHDVRVRARTTYVHVRRTYTYDVRVDVRRTYTYDVRVDVRRTRRRTTYDVRRRTTYVAYN